MAGLERTLTTKKKLLLEFYRELLPIFKKYGAMVESGMYGGDEYQNFAVRLAKQADPIPGGFYLFNADILISRIKELENEKTTT
jgi:hypothetical protein